MKSSSSKSYILMFKPDLIYDVVNYAWNFTLNILLFVIEKKLRYGKAIRQILEFKCHLLVAGAGSF